MPGHIDPDKLPTNVSYRSHGGVGSFRLAYWDDVSGKRKFVRLCDGAATLSQIWEAVDARAKKPPEATFRSLSLGFQGSLDWKKLGQSTRDDYLECHKGICGSVVKGGALFGDVPISRWTTGTVLKYRDARGAESPSRANKELGYIKRVLSRARLYEETRKDVSSGVPKLTVAPRKHYAEDKDFQFLLQVARESSYWYMPYVLVLAYECALRLCEIVDLNDARELPEGLKIVGRKGSNTNIISWGVTLRGAWDEAKAKRNQIYADKKIPLPFKPEDRHLFVSEFTGDRLKEKAIKTAKNRLDRAAKEKAGRLGVEYVHFWLHDVKKKSITDDGSANKKDKSRHKTDQMADLYDLSIKTARPTSDD